MIWAACLPVGGIMMQRNRYLAAMACMTMLSAGSEAAAQSASDVETLRTAFRAAAAQVDLGNGFQALTILGATPGISAATFNVDDPGGGLDISSYKVSPSYTFDPVYGIKPYVELTLGYTAAEENVLFAISPGSPTVAEVDYDAFTGLVGAGIELDILDRTVLRPIFLMGYSQIRNSAKITGPFASLLSQGGRGIAFDVRINSMLLGGALELNHQRTFEGVQRDKQGENRATIRMRTRVRRIAGRA